MNKSILAICDLEERYMYKLQEILEERETFPFQIFTYTDSQMMVEDIKRKGIEVVLISDTMMNSMSNAVEKQITDKLLIIVLDSGKCEYGDIPGIWKYQAGEAIRKDILKVFSECKEQKAGLFMESSSLPRGKRKTKIIGFFSPVGRCLKTSYAITLGQILAKSVPVLYLNLQSFSGIREDVSTGDSKDVTDLIYFMNGGVDRMLLKMEEMISTINSLDYIKPASSFMDISSVDKDEWIELINVLKSFGNYEFIIIDFSMEVKGIPDILRCCSQVITITRNEEREIRKVEEYEEYLRNNDYEDILAKTRKIELPSLKRITTDIRNLPESELADYIEKTVKEDYLGEL